MGCGRMSVEGEAEEIAASHRPRSRQRHGKRSNPYSTLGLDKFETVYAELSTRREYIAKKAGVPGELVRFTHSNKGWIPVVVRAREGIGKKINGEGAAGVSILRPVENNNGLKDGELTRKDEGSRINGDSESISISVLEERSHGLVMPWSRILKTTAFGVLCLSAISVRRSVVPAAATMAVGGVICMKKFILRGFLYSPLLFRYPRNLNTSQNGGNVEAIAQKKKKEIDKPSSISPRAGFTVRAIAPSGPLRASVKPIEYLASASPRAVKPKSVNHEHKRHHHNKSKAKTFRVVSMDNRSARTASLQGSDSFYSRTRPAMAYDPCAGATAIIITLFCLVFYGRLSAIFFTSAWWYLLPVFGHHSERTNMNNENSRVVDLQSNEHRKKAIRDGLLERKHN